jgi:hypothetical protein
MIFARWCSGVGSEKKLNICARSSCPFVEKLIYSTVHVSGGCFPFSESSLIFFLFRQKCVLE